MLPAQKSKQLSAISISRCNQLSRSGNEVQTYFSQIDKYFYSKFQFPAATEEARRVVSALNKPTIFPLLLV